MGIEEEVLFGMRDNWPSLDQARILTGVEEL